MDTVRKSFSEFDCVLIQASNIGKVIVRKLAVRSFHAAAQVDVEGFTEWLATLQDSEHIGVLPLNPAYIDEPTPAPLWWQLPNASANYQYLTTQSVNPYCEPCTTKCIDEITDEVAMDVEGLVRSVLHGDISQLLGKAYVRHLWETAAQVFQALPSIRARRDQCDICRQLRPKGCTSCASGLEAHCAKNWQQKHWKAGHKNRCRQRTKDKCHAVPVSSSEQRFLR